MKVIWNFLAFMLAAAFTFGLVIVGMAAMVHYVLPFIERVFG